MRILLVASKNSGNSYSICNYIANNSKIDLLVLENNIEIDFNKYDAIVFASGVYANRVQENLIEFIKSQTSNNNSSIKYYLLLTWIGRGNSLNSAINHLSELALSRQIKFDNNYFNCYGNLKKIIKKNHPNEEDYKNALNWINSL